MSVWSNGYLQWGNMPEPDFSGCSIQPECKMTEVSTGCLEGSEPVEGECTGVDGVGCYRSGSPGSYVVYAKDENGDSVPLSNYGFADDYCYHDLLTVWSNGTLQW